MSNIPVYLGGLKSFSITMNEQSLTDKVTYITADNYANINDAVNGDFFNYHFRFKVSDTEKRGILQTCNCMADIDELLYSQLNYTLGKNKQSYISEHMIKIASLLGKELVINTENFKLTLDTHQENITYADLIRNLVGWTARVPHIMINCHLIGDKLYVTQRGKEINVVDITETDHTMPTVKQSFERITWGSSPDSNTNIVSKTKDYMHSFEWEARKQNNDTKAIHQYDAEDSVEQTVIRNSEPPELVIVNYFYKMENGAKFLYLEEEKQYERASDSEMSTFKQTFHTSLGQGQRSTTVYEDGNYVGSAIGNTSGNDRASQWEKKMAYWNEHKEWQEKIPGNPLIDTEFPLERTDQLRGIAEALQWLNRKTKEVLTFDIENFEHIITFEDLITFEGKNYFLQSNTISASERISNRQTVSLVRWF